MKWSKSLVTAIFLLSLAGCGGGSGGDSNPTVNPAPENSNLSKTTLSYNKPPTIEEEFKISIEDNTSTITNDYSWNIISAPPSSNLQLTPSIDSKSALLTATVVGQYAITATPATGELIETQFFIKKELPFDATKLKGYDNTQSLSKQVGIVSNQAWVYSETLDQTAIEAIVSDYSGFTIIDFDEIRGLLVEFNDAHTQSQLNINLIKAEVGINSVYLRVFEGKEFRPLFEKEANDGSAFDDEGDNWHLEHIGIVNAWDISTGNNEFYIGISESYNAFYTDHEDLRGKFKEATKAENVSEGDESGINHATGIAGTIGAITDNNKGISGINWQNQLIGGGPGYNGLERIIKKGNVPMINGAWSLLFRGIPEGFDPNDADSVIEINENSLEFTREYRILAGEHSNILFVFSAGNGVSGGENNDVFGVDGRHGDPALHYIEKEGVDILQKKRNVIFVAAHLKDNRLAYYSLFGRSIDIAAPAGFKSTKKDKDVQESFQETDEYYTTDKYGSDNNRKNDGSFTGTSAASSVVTGVASLILATDPDLTAANVKSILVNSATEHVNNRYKAPSDEAIVSGNGNTGPNSNIESLTHPIPILNAASALSMAKEIKDGRDIIVEYNFSDPFNPTIGFSLLSPNGKLILDSYTYRFSAQETGASVDYVEFASGNVTSQNPLFVQNIGINNTHYKFEANGALFVHEASEVSITTNLDIEFVIPKITAISTDKNTQAKIPNVAIEIKPEDGSFPRASGSTDINGDARLYLTPGKYTIIAKANGYEDLTIHVEVNETDTSLDIRLELTSNTTNTTPSGEVAILTPITPLTSSETVTNTGGDEPVTFIYESGFEGDIEVITRPVESGPLAFYDQETRLKADISSINVVDIQRDIGISLTCQDGGTPREILSADYSTNRVDHTGSANGQTLSCSSTYQSILPASLTDNSLAEILVLWGVDENQSNAAESGLISTDCPQGDDAINVLGVSPSNQCSVNRLINYLITDDTGKEHKVSTRLIIN